MLTNVYKTTGGYYYKKHKNKKKRISKDEYKKHKNRKPVIGDQVKIIIKPYNKKIYKIGIVTNVLTKKKYHSRGHKVKIKLKTNNIIIGRIIDILK